ARPPLGLATQVPAAVKELPGQLKGDEGLASAGRKSQQDTLFLGRHSLQDALHGQFLVVAARVAAAFVLVRNFRKAVAPVVLLGKGALPKLLRSWEGPDLALFARFHVDG